MPKRAKTASYDIEAMLSYRVSSLYSLIQAGTARQLDGGFRLILREWRVLALLAKLEPVTASDLAARSPMDKASISRAVASLAKRDLIRSRPDDEDGRVQQLELTQEGRRLYARIAPVSQARNRDLLSALTASEQTAFFRSLDKLIARADALLQPPESRVAPATKRRTISR